MGFNSGFKGLKVVAHRLSQQEHTVETKNNNRIKIGFNSIPYNLLSPTSSEQLSTSQNATAFWLTIFVNVRVVAGRC
jgi:hypothetical protein